MLGKRLSSHRDGEQLSGQNNQKETSICAHRDCNTSRKSKFSTWCEEHSTLKTCRSTSCSKPARYRIEGVGKQWCYEHATIGMVHERGDGSFSIIQKCTFDTCTDRRLKQKWCAEHSHLTMCRHLSCTSAALYNFEGAGKQWCFEHAQVGMIMPRTGRPNTIIQLCAFEECNVKARKKWCEEHTSSNECKSEGCEVKPLYNYLGAGGQWCAQHKTIDMVDVLSTRCMCGKSVKARFGEIGDTQAKYCSDCKVPGMIIKGEFLAYTQTLLLFTTLCG